MPGSASSWASARSRSAPGSRHSSPDASAVASPVSARPRARGIGSVAGSTSASVSAAREAVRQRAVRPLQRLAVGGHQPRPQPPGGGDGYLLAEHRPQRELVAVHVAGRPPSGLGPGQRPEHRVGGQVAGDRLGVRVQVEQAAAALDRGGQVAQILELELAVEIAGITSAQARDRATRSRCRSAAGSSVRTGPLPPIRPREWPGPPESRTSGPHRSAPGTPAEA